MNEFEKAKQDILEKISGGMDMRQIIAVYA